MTDSARKRWRWRARVSSTAHKYHRVEVEGADLADTPVALVPDQAHAKAIAALPRIADALRETSELLKRCECMAHGAADDEAAAALQEMEGLPWNG
jgi:hypothetical protein